MLFQKLKFKRLRKASLIFFDVFECVLISSTNNIDFGPNTKKYQDHIVSSYDYKLICVYERYSKSCKTYFGQNAMDKFLNDMIKENEYCSKVIEIKFNKLLAMTEKDHEDFNNSIKYWICN